jgi:CRISPR-associated endonuclease/helicase Cas3
MFKSESWASLAGLWHDLGKYSPAFQQCLGLASGADAHIETNPGRVDHSTAGALHAVQQFGTMVSIEHTGLSPRISPIKPVSPMKI